MPSYRIPYGKPFDLKLQSGHPSIGQIIYSKSGKYAIVKYDDPTRTKDEYYGYNSQLQWFEVASNNPNILKMSGAPSGSIKHSITGIPAYHKVYAVVQTSNDYKVSKQGIIFSDVGIREVRHVHYSESLIVVMDYHLILGMNGYEVFIYEHTLTLAKNGYSVSLDKKEIKDAVWEYSVFQNMPFLRSPYDSTHDKILGDNLPYIYVGKDIMITSEQVIFYRNGEGWGYVQNGMKKHADKILPINALEEYNMFINLE